VAERAWRKKEREISREREREMEGSGLKGSERREKEWEIEKGGERVGK
jgi:hypothetical protein